MLHGLIRRDGVQIRLPPGRGAPAQLGRPPTASAALSLLPPPPPAKKAKLKAAGTASPWGKQDLSAAAAAGIFWASDVEPSPLNLCRFSLQPPPPPCGPWSPSRGGHSPLPTPFLLRQGVDRGPWQWLVLPRDLAGIWLLGPLSWPSASMTMTIPESEGQGLGAALWYGRCPWLSLVWMVGGT